MKNSETHFDGSQVQDDLGLFRALYIATPAEHVKYAQCMWNKILLYQNTNNLELSILARNKLKEHILSNVTPRISWPV